MWTNLSDGYCPINYNLAPFFQSRQLSQWSSNGHYNDVCFYIICFWRPNRCLLVDYVLAELLEYVLPASIFLFNFMSHIIGFLGSFTALYTVILPSFLSQSLTLPIITAAIGQYLVFPGSKTPKLQKPLVICVVMCAYVGLDLLLFFFFYSMATSSVLVCIYCVHYCLCAPLSVCKEPLCVYLTVECPH